MLSKKQLKAIIDEMDRNGFVNISYTGDKILKWSNDENRMVIKNGLFMVIRDAHENLLGMMGPLVCETERGVSLCAELLRNLLNNKIKDFLQQNGDEA